MRYRAHPLSVKAAGESQKQPSRTGGRNLPDRRDAFIASPTNGAFLLAARQSEMVSRLWRRAASFEGRRYSGELSAFNGPPVVSLANFLGKREIANRARPCTGLTGQIDDVAVARGECNLRKSKRMSRRGVLICPAKRRLRLQRD